MYTQVIESLPALELPHPNPPLIKGRELDFLVSPLYKGGLRGVKPGSQSNSDLCVHGSLGKERDVRNGQGEVFHFFLGNSMTCVYTVVLVIGSL